MTDHEQLDLFFDRRRASMVEDIRALVRVNSVKGEACPGAPFGSGPTAALDAALALARREGFAARNVDGYVGVVDLNDAPTELGILAHLDVMPQGTGWTYPPFDVTEHEGKLYGRGTADDKGPAVAALYAMMAVKAIRPELHKNVRLILGTDEESGSADIAYYFAREAPPPHVFSPDGDFPVINIEKGRFAPVFRGRWLRQKEGARVLSIVGGQRHNAVPQQARATIAGLSPAKLAPVIRQVERDTGVEFQLGRTPAGLTLYALGTGAHGAQPEKGNNALTALLSVLAALPLADSPSAQMIRGLAALFPHGDTQGKALGLACADETSGPLTLNFSVLDLNQTGFSAQFDCRFPLCAKEEELLSRLSDAISPLGAEVADPGLVPPHCVPEDDPFVQTLLGVYHDYTGLPARCLAIGGGTYVHDIPGGVAFGCAMPGVDNRMHEPDEFAILDDLVLSAKMFAQVILDVCG